MNDEYEVIMSPLCQSITSEGVEVQIDIYADGDGDGGWILEIIDGENNSIVWDDPFKSDKEALKEAVDTIKKEGISSLSKNSTSALH